MPRPPGTAGPLRSDGGATEPGGGQTAQAGRVWESGQQQLSGLHPQGLLCGRHAARLPGKTAASSLFKCYNNVSFFC